MARIRDVLTVVCIAASGSGEINNISGYIPETAWMPD
jgi:hypothetical protein